MTAHSTLARPAGVSPLRALIRRYPVTAFLVMTFGFAWGLMAPLLLSRQGFGLLPLDLPVPLFQWLTSYAGLALPAFLVTAAVGGRAGVVDLLRQSLRWRVGVRWYLVALFGVLGGVLLLALPLFGVSPLLLLVQRWELLLTTFLPAVLLMVMSTNLPEEVAWTGFLQARLQVRRGPLIASLLTAPAFALMHLPAFFVDGWIAEEGLAPAQLPEALLSLGVVTVFAVFFRVAVMWLYNGSGGSLLLVGLFHSAFNVVNSRALTPSFIAEPAAAALLPLAAVAVAAVTLAVVTRGRLGYR
jgi:membrane protease YdiL (CAAX protease family)